MYKMEINSKWSLNCIYWPFQQTIYPTYNITTYNGAWGGMHSQQTRCNWYNIAPITIQIYVVYGQETCIYTIFNRHKRTCTAGQYSGFYWPVHDVMSGSNQNSLKASSKYGHWRKYVILWVGRPICSYSMS